MAQPDTDGRGGISARLQPFAHKESGYERVEQPWVCGRKAAGQPCERGPDWRGNCPFATDAAALAGLAGRPCRPRRSVRNRRGLTSRLVVLVTIGAMVALLSGRRHADFVSPGSVSDAHADVACGDCHAGATGESPWPGLSLDETGCLACHELAGGEDVRAPHSLPAGSLRERVRAATKQAPPPRSRLNALLARDPAELAADCRSCHHEHRGAGSTPIDEDDTRCQTCHVQSFRSLQDGHPEFTDYPDHARRTYIAFDHVQHYALHFPGQSATRVCSDCHQPESDGRTMALRGFDAACSSCHAAGLDESLREQVPVLIGALPLDQVEHAAPALRDADLRGSVSAGLRAALASAGIAGSPAGGDPGPAPGAPLLARASATALAHLVDPEPADAVSLRAGVSLRPDEGRGDIDVLYRPLTHGDAFLRDWIPLVLELAEPARFRALFRERSPLRGCLVCHTADRAADGTVVVHWHGRTAADSSRDSLVRFVHAPHLRQGLSFSQQSANLAGSPLIPEMQTPDQACAFCHRLSTETRTLAASFALGAESSPRPVERISDFDPMDRERCATCHSRQTVPSSCLTCHRYHAGGSRLRAQPNRPQGR